MDECITSTASATPFSLAQFQCCLSYQANEPEWDAFLAATPGGSYPQSTLWARAKSALGYRAVRVVIRKGERVVGGAQMLIRPKSIAQAFGYVPRAPIMHQDHSGLAKLIVEKLHQVARTEGIRILVIQPPPGSDGVLHALGGSGFLPCPLELAPSATCLIDLSKSQDAIFAQMRPKTRRNIRFGERKGVTVREGSQKDVSVFYRLLTETSRRQRFSPYPEDYFSEIWRALAPAGNVELLIAELKGEPVTALFAIAFGNTVTDWRVGWCGAYGSYHPNEVIKWAAIKWAKSQGYHYYDLGGVRRDAVEMRLRGEAMPNSLAAAVHFKVQFGGLPTLFPEAFMYIRNPLLRRSYLTVPPRFAARALKTVINWF
jgi:lipid II:glycine glycyltransferase (peptidoglycan interpeptide bridge formation enzyme)